MKMAHLIMAYKDPKQVERLVKKLYHQNFDFYIHLDKKIDIKDFLFLKKLKNVKFTKKRFVIQWGAYSFTNAIIKSIEDILHESANYDFINVMSAQEYPIKPVDFIYNFYENHIGYSFFSYEKNGSEWWKLNIGRVEKYALTNFKFKGQYIIESLINAILPKRKFPLPYTLYGGPCCTWWTVSRDCAEYLVKFINKNSSIRRFAFFSFIADEFLVATIVMNSNLKDKVINNNYRYIDWSQGGVNPKILTVNDFQFLKESNQFFARKFDTTKDVQILNMLDKIT